MNEKKVKVIVQRMPFCLGIVLIIIFALIYSFSPKSINNSCA